VRGKVSELDASQVEPYRAAQLPARIPSMNWYGMVPLSAYPGPDKAPTLAAAAISAATWSRSVFTSPEVTRTCW